MLRFKSIRNDNGDIKEIQVAIESHQLLSSPKLNKGAAFSQEERNVFKLEGMIPNRVETLEEQSKRHYQQFQEKKTDLGKNVYLNELHDNNETLFYHLVAEHLEEMLPIIYTPTVGEAVEKFSHELRRTRGLFISYPDIDRIPEILEHRLNPEVDLILVTDGEGVLGIGDQGIGGMDIAIGKLMVYTLCAGINPHRVLPIQLDVGTNNEKLLNDPMYLGWRNKRISGPEYDKFIDAFVSAVRKKMPRVYLHWEDFGRDNARRNLERYREKMCTFNDDMQGTGAVALACVLAGVQASGTEVKDQRIVILGAGTAGCGIADQIHDALTRHGLSEQDARDYFWMVDRNGLLVNDMNELASFQAPYARKRDELNDWKINDKSNITLAEVVANVKPTILIGCSTVTGAFNEDIVKAMAKHVEHPVILPLSNPTSRAEAHPSDLLKWTDGKALVATGSPFDDVDFKGKKIRISQSNNAFVFPGLGLGVIASQAEHVTDNMIWAACQRLVAHSPAKHDKAAPLLPDLNDIQKVSADIAHAVAQAAINEQLAQRKISDIDRAIRSVKWEPKYYPYVKPIAQPGTN